MTIGVKDWILSRPEEEIAMGKFAVILPAAGRSRRFGDPKQKKIYAELEGRAVWLRAAEPFVNRDDVGQIVIAIAAEDRELFERRYRASVAFMNIKVIEGGAERSDTVACALEVIDPACDYIAVHDAARPCLSALLIDAVFEAARAHGAALLATPVAETIKRAGEGNFTSKRAGEGNFTSETVERAGLYLAQTPQAFERSLLYKAYQERSQIAGHVTDDCRLVEALGHRCAIVPGSPLNIKITTPLDLKIAAAFLPLLEKPTRAKSAHPFEDEQAMWGDLPKLKPSDLFGS
jgi:2-C-methyl-D-erythritol 4-phosphate cytidylyltransferase